MALTLFKEVPRRQKCVLTGHHEGSWLDHELGFLSRPSLLTTSTDQSELFKQFMLWFLDVLVVNLGRQWLSYCSSLSSPLLSLLSKAVLLGGKTPEQTSAWDWSQFSSRYQLLSKSLASFKIPREIPRCSLPSYHWAMPSRMYRNQDLGILLHQTKLRHLNGALWIFLCYSSHSREGILIHWIQSYWILKVYVKLVSYISVHFYSQNTWQKIRKERYVLAHGFTELSPCSFSSMCLGRGAMSAEQCGGGELCIFWRTRNTRGNGK